MWSKKHHCQDGKRCALRQFPNYLINLWDLTQNAVTVVGMGSVELDVKKLEWFLGRILHIPEEEWGKIYESCNDLLSKYLKFFNKGKKISVHLDLDDMKTLWEIGDRAKEN